jgi:hypothetical protein
VTIDFYYTALRTAEVYLGSVSGLSGAQTVSVPNLPPVAGGYVRVQTQGTSPTSQPYESSQFSVAVAIPTANLASCLTPKMSIDLTAWRSVNEVDTEILDGSTVIGNDPIWYGYTVANTGYVTITNVVVRNRAARQVCVVPELAGGQSATCSEPAPITD